MTKDTFGIIFVAVIVLAFAFSIPVVLPVSMFLGVVMIILTVFLGLGLIYEIVKLFKQPEEETTDAE